jgi:hypothetical protein
MKELIGDIWAFWQAGHFVGVTTNGMLNTKGELIMGRGIALQAKRRLPFLPLVLGDQVRRHGNQVFISLTARIVAIPTKHDWRDPADLELIRTSALSLSRLLEAPEFAPLNVYLPRLGCGNGGLDWDTVRPILAEILPDSVTVVHDRRTELQRK